MSAGLATIITSLNPVLVAAVAAPLLGEPMTPRKLLGLILGFAGAAFVVRNRIVLSGEDPRGILLLLVGLVSVTAGTLLFKRASPRASLATIVGLQQAGAAVAVLTVGFATEAPSAMQFDLPRFWLTLAWFVFVVSIGSFLLWFLLLRRGTASSASSLHFLMPPIGLFLSWLVLGEKLQVIDLFGVVPVALGIWLATTGTPVPAAAPAIAPR